MGTLQHDSLKTGSLKLKKDIDEQTSKQDPSFLLYSPNFWARSIEASSASTEGTLYSANPNIIHTKTDKPYIQSQVRKKNLQESMSFHNRFIYNCKKSQKIRLAMIYEFRIIASAAGETLI